MGKDRAERDVALEVGERIRSVRLARRLRLHDLAEAAGVPPHAAWQIEKGELLPRGQALGAIADLLGVSAAYILEGGDVALGPSSFSSGEYALSKQSGVEAIVVKRRPARKLPPTQPELPAVREDTPTAVELVIEDLGDRLSKQVRRQLRETIFHPCVSLGTIRSYAIDLMLALE